MKENMNKNIKERIGLSLSGLWLLTSVFVLITPIFLPSAAGAPSFGQNVVGASTVAMFVLSFPSSFFGLPMMFFAGIVLGTDADSMSGMYLNLFLLFVLGFVQWFWILPQIWQSEPRLQTLNLFYEKSEMPFLRAEPIKRCEPNDFKDYTPLERVIYEKDEM